MAVYYEFFFSFSSIDWKKGKKDDLEIFFNDLKEKLKDFGFRGAGFFAPDAIERGSDWHDKLCEALPASQVLVPVYSPNYFMSTWCGKEWEVFWRRQEENKRAPPPDVTAPEIILPVLWNARFLEMSDRVSEIQYKQAVSDSPIYMDFGLSYMMQAPKRFSNHYREFLDRFATKLGRMVRAQGALKMRPIPNLDDIDLPFPARHRRGLSHVHYIFLAGRRDEMQKERTRCECYGNYENRQDWRPCFPDEDQLVGDLARTVAAESGKVYEFVEPREIKELVKAIHEASTRKNIIAIVVDPWSLRLNSFKAFAEKIDADSFPTSGVVVTWNEKDAETVAEMPVLKNRLADHFRGRLRRQEYYNNNVRTPGELREALIATFNTAQERLVEAGQIRPAGPSDPVPQPLLHVAP